MQAELLIKETNTKLEKYQNKLKKDIEKLEIDYDLDFNPDYERFRNEVYPILLEIDQKVYFVRKNVANSIENNDLKCLISNKIIEISESILKVANIFKEFKSCHKIIEAVMPNCYHISIEISFLLSWVILNLKDENNVQNSLNHIKQSLKLLDYTRSREIQTIFESTINDSFSNYTSYVINISEKTNLVYQEIVKNHDFSPVKIDYIETLNKIKEYRKKIKVLLKKILDHQKNQLRSDVEEDIVIEVFQTSWNQYTGLVSTLGDISWCRISYANGILKLMCPGIKHENTNRSIDTLIVAYCDDREIDYVLLGSTTAKSQEEKKGKEPDSGYILEKLEDDREIPDLAVEVNFSSGSLKDLSIYKSLGVKEVWMWEKKDTLTFHILVNGEYKTIDRSLFFKDITTEIISKYASLIMLNKKKTRLYKKEFIAEINQDTPENE